MSGRLFDNPFSDSTIVKNVILDRIMPALSPAGWKVLCVALRQTWGGFDPTSSSGHTAEADISYSQFVEKTGLRERDVITGALQECLEAGYLVVRQMEQDAQTGEPSYAYALNTAFEMREAEIALPSAAVKEDVIAFPSPEHESAFQVLMDFGREMGVDPDPALAGQAVTDNAPETVLAWVETGQEMTHLESAQRFQTILQRILDRVPPLLMPAFAPDDQDEGEQLATPGDLTAQGVWQATLGELRSKVRKSKFRWLTPTQAVGLSGSTLTVAVPNERTREWLEEGQLAETIQQTVEAVAGQSIELTFVVQA